MMIRLLLTVGAELLCAALANEQGADHALFRYFQEHPQIGSQERRALSDAVYGCLRCLRSLGYTAGQTDQFTEKLTQYQARARLAAWLVTEGNCSREEIRNTLGTEANFLWENFAPDSILSRAAAADLPDWIYEALITELGSDAEVQALARALAQPAPLDLRVNTLRANCPAVVRRLRAEGLDAILTPFSPAGIRLPARTAILEHELYRQGLVEIQDEGSQLIALLLAPRRHEIVVDFCAGAGGKTLHLGALMANSGTIYAFDSTAYRLDQLRARAARAGLTTLHIVRIDQLAAPPLLALRGKADRVLVDAPCTGTGTARRRPDIKWHHHDLARLSAAQGRILASAATLVRPGGKLVYATCSILGAENDAVVAEFLKNNEHFIQLPLDSLLARLNSPLIFAKEELALRLYPHRHGTDGFYAALLERVH